MKKKRSYLVLILTSVLFITNLSGCTGMSNSNKASTNSAVEADKKSSVDVLGDEKDKSVDNLNDEISMPIPKPFYNLYFNSSGDNSVFSQKDLKMMANQLKFVYGAFKPDQIAYMHQCNPDFKVLRYITTFEFSGIDRMRYAESNRFDLEYYLAAVLKNEINESTNVLQLQAAWDNIPVSLKQSTIDGDYSLNTQRYVTWLRLNNELMRIEKFDKKTLEVTVTRGFAGTKPEKHSKGSYVFHPTYNSKGYPGLKKNDYGLDASTLAYIPDPATLMRWNDVVNQALAWVGQGYDGVWIDCLSARSFNSVDIDGKNTSGKMDKVVSSIEEQEDNDDGKKIVTRVWNFVDNTFYTFDKHRECAEKGINYAQEELNKKLGCIPVLFANNITLNYFLNNGGKKLLIMSTDIKPRPLDGFCVESFVSAMENEDFGRFLQDSEKKVAPKIKAHNQWKQSMQVTMDSMQDKLAIMPMMSNAGWKVRMIEALSDEMLGPVELFGYASYLLCVEKDAPAAYGVPAGKIENGIRQFRLNPMYFWPIGEPVDRQTYENIDLYRPEGKNTYVRRFTNGIVLVNPTNGVDAEIQLDESYIDPETNESLTSIKMQPRSAKILLTKWNNSI